LTKPITLITGSTGFLGSRLAKTLLRDGYSVRAFARNASKAVKLQALGAEIFIGDVRDPVSLTAAIQGAAVVVHAAAETAGDALAGQQTTLQGTQNVIESASAKGVKQLIYISSCSIYGIADCSPGQRIDEAGPLERRPEWRGHYSNAKFKAEQTVLAAIGKGELKITCLRPGTVWGPGGEIFTPMMGFKVGQRLAGIIESGRFTLPLVFVDNLVDAIIACISHPAAYDNIFNVVDDDPIDKDTYTREVLIPLFPRTVFFRIPYWLLFGAVGFQERMCRIVGKKPYLTRYRLISSQRPVVYDAGRIARELGWSPPIKFDQAARRVLQHSKDSVPTQCTGTGS